MIASSASRQGSTWRCRPRVDGPDAQLVAAVRAGTLPESVLDTAAARAIDLVRKAGERPAIAGPLDVDAHSPRSRGKPPVARSCC